MNTILRNALAASGLAITTSAVAGVTLYEHEGFEGRTFTAQRPTNDLARLGFNDRASSVIVSGERWEVCEDARFSGRCMVLRPGRYPSLESMGMNDQISSMRPVASNARIDERRYAPLASSNYGRHDEQHYASNDYARRDEGRYAAAPQPNDAYRRRGDERLYEADVTSVRAVVGQSGQRCWVEREQVQQHGDVNVPGAVVGAVIGGILGHQVGSGRGNDVATVGGAVVGGAVGANVGRDGAGSSYQDVRHCDTVPSQTRADYWDVTYNFRGEEHRVQMTAPPGRTVSVNERGEPRV